MLVPCPHCRSVIEKSCEECPWCLAPQERPRQQRQGRFQIRLWVLLLLIAGLGCWLGVTLQTLRPKSERSGPANILEQLDETRP